MPLAEFIETPSSKSQNINTRFILYKIGLMLATVGFLLRLKGIDLVDGTAENEREKMSFSLDQISTDAFMATCLLGLGIGLAKNAFKTQESYSNWIKRSFDLNKLSHDVSFGCSIGMLILAFNMTYHLAIGFFIIMWYRITRLISIKKLT